MISSKLITISANGGHISMATKKATVKKAAPRASKAPAKTAKATGIKRIAYEANPDAHVATGKFRFLLCFMMVTMIIFAGIAVCAIRLPSETTLPSSA